MRAFRVALIGHRSVEDYFRVEKELNRVITSLICEKEFVEFRLGRNGEFDIMAASCIKNVQHSLDRRNSEMTLVLAYPVADMGYYAKYYDNVLIPQEIEGLHFKRAITERNKWLVENCDLFIAYAKNVSGGAGSAVRYAKRIGTPIFNLSDYVDGV
ncbi:MAG: hypothetical protein J6B55_06510 [Clostridia bacterium]|nr:hypothetical protein [Clostridia bacterium]